MVPIVPQDGSWGFIMPLRNSGQTLSFRLNNCFMATRANAVAEFDGRLCTDIAFHLLSIVSVVADLLAARTHRKEAVELLHVRKSILELPHSAGKVLMKLKDAHPYSRSGLHIRRI